MEPPVIGPVIVPGGVKPAAIGSVINPEGIEPPPLARISTLKGRIGGNKELRHASALSLLLTPR